VIYSPGQAEVLFSFWPPDAEWFIVGGPADGNEAETVKEKYPDVECIGFEPDPEMYAYQKTRFPGVIYNEALWSSATELSLVIPGSNGNINHRCSSVCRDIEKERQAETHTVAGWALDDLSAKYGPFRNAVLWIDIEFAELEALKGCARLLESGRVLLINLETYDHLYAEIEDYLTQYNFVATHKWNTRGQRGRFDMIFTKGTEQ